MPSQKSFSLRARFRSFAHAFRGLRQLLIGEHNARIHAGCTLIVLIAGFSFKLSRLEWCAIVIAIMSVWTSEALNTSIEHLCDAAFPQPHPLVGNAKDVAAAGVLVSALGSIVIGALVFGPHLFALTK